TLMGVFASLALDSAAHRFYWDTENPADRKSTIACWTWSWLIIASTASIVVLLRAEGFARELTGTSDASRALMLAVGALPFGVLGVVYTNRLRMQRRPWAVTIYAMLSSLMMIGMTAVFVLVLRQGIEGVFLAQFIVSFISTAVIAILLKDWIHPRLFEWKRF